VTVKGQRKTCVNGRLTGNLGLDYPSKYDGYRGYNRNYNRDYNRGYNRDYKRGYNANKVFNNVYSKNNIYNRYDDFGGIFDDYDYGRQQACGGCRWKGRVYCSGDVIEDLPSWKFETRCIDGKAKVVARQWGELADRLP